MSELKTLKDFKKEMSEVPSSEIIRAYGNYETGFETARDYLLTGLRAMLLSELKRLNKEAKKYELGLMVDLTDVCEKTGVSEEQRRNSLWTPLQQVRGKIDFITELIEPTESEVLERSDEVVE